MASIKDLKRMCAFYEGTCDYCSDCPLYEPNKLCVPYKFFDNADEIVDKWVQEHPIKTYADDFFEKFPNAQRLKNIPARWEKRCYTKKLDQYGEVYRTNEPSFICTNCRTANNSHSNYCPNCGAKMIKDGDAE